MIHWGITGSCVAGPARVQSKSIEEPLNETRNPGGISYDFCVRKTPDNRSHGRSNWIHRNSLRGD